MDQYLKKLDTIFEDLFIKKAPPLSKNAKEWIVKAAPWLVLIFALIAIPSILAALGFGAVTAPFWLFTRHSALYFVSVIIGIIQLVLQLMAVSPLFKRAKRGWSLLYYSSLLGIVSSIIHLSPFGLVFAALGLYFLYQVREYYK